MNAFLPNLSPRTTKIIVLTTALVCVGLVAAIGAFGHKSAVTFRACFGALLAILGVAQLHVSVALFKNRENSLLQLSQPIALSLFALSGAIATFGSITLALPEYTAACAIRQPVILTCVSLMGTVLVTRAWRIGCLVSSTLSFASSDEAKVDKMQLARANVMHVLSKLSGWTLFVGSCGRYRSERGTTKSLRRQVTLADAMRVTVVLVLPQVLLQIVNLSVPSIRMQSVEVHDGVYTCQSSTGPLFLILGIILAVVPFLVALLLNIESAGGVHKLFREFDQLLACGEACVGVLIITLPTLGMHANTIPSVHAYLLAASLLSFILPLCYHIAWSRMHNIRQGKVKNDQKVLRRSTSSTLQSSSAGTRGDDLETLQQAEDASASSKMFESMGNLKKAIEVDNEILTMFKKEGDYTCDDGFLRSEINSFGPKTLKMVVSTLMTYSQRLNSHAHNSSPEEQKELIRKLCKSGPDALSIFEKAPAKASLKDRSFVFPGYSLLSMMIDAGTTFADNQSPAELENECASNFVEESQFQVYHHCRALAMKAVALARVQKFGGACSVLEKMKGLYNPALHTAAIAGAYGTDHCSSMIAVSALWYNRLHQREKALSICEDVIQQILPEVERTNENNSNLLGLNYLLYPIIQVLRLQGRDGANRAYELYNSHVLGPFNSGVKRMGPGTIFIRPMKILLTCCSSTATDKYNVSLKYGGMDDDIEWMLNGESKIVNEFDTLITNVFHWSFYSLLAEVCLHLAKRLDFGCGKQHDLIKEGLRFSGLADPKMKDKDGNVTNFIAFEFHTRVDTELRNFGDSNV